MTNALLQRILSLREQREPGALCTIVKTEGSTPLKIGAHMLVQSDGSITGTIGGGALEHSVIKQAVIAISSKENQLVQHRLTLDHNMCCGGTVQLYIEVLEVPPQCFIFGAGHVGKALATLCSTLDFDVVLIDGRPNIFDRLPDETTLHDGQMRYLKAEPSTPIPSLIWDSTTYAIIATHSHPLDREILRLALRQPFKYCGMIGSNRKVIVTRKLFIERGWATEAELDRIDMPIGIDIAASSPTEIAVSIGARMIEVKNRKTPPLATGQSPQMLSSFIPDYNNDIACTSATL